jgi:hypothetical protein
MCKDLQHACSGYGMITIILSLAVDRCLETHSRNGDETEWETTWSADMPKPMLLGNEIR